MHRLMNEWMTQVIVEQPRLHRICLKHEHEHENMKIKKKNVQYPFAQIQIYNSINSEPLMWFHKYFLFKFWAGTVKNLSLSLQIKET